MKGAENNYIIYNFKTSKVAPSKLNLCQKAYSSHLFNDLHLNFTWVFTVLKDWRYLQFSNFSYHNDSTTQRSADMVWEF